MPKKVMELTPPLFYYHHRDRGKIAFKAFLRAAQTKVKNLDCTLSSEVGQMGDVTVEVVCPTKMQLRMAVKGVRVSAQTASRLQGMKR